jgi:hypothetical protein
VTAELLLDNSAWARLDHAALPQARTHQVADLVEGGHLATCLPFLLEAGYSARSGRDQAVLLDELGGLPLLRIDEHVESRSLHGQRQLARAGHHRLPPVDLIIAAIADARKVGILHYDGDYDLIADKTDLQFASVWLAPRGSL